MSRTISPNSRTVTVSVALSIRGRRFDMEMGVLADTVEAEAMLPLFRSFAEGFVDLAVKEAQQQGKTVTCQKGCGACCRQLVPISAIEARQLAKLVDSMPPVRRQIIRQRFANARLKLHEAGLLDVLLQPEAIDQAQREKLAPDYFALGIACPFLENESCSIHTDRPIACREYLVTSPAKFCASPTPDQVDMIASPLGQVWTWLARLDASASDDYSGWIPLILALDYAASHPADHAARPGPQWMADFLKSATPNSRETALAETKST